MNIFPWPMIRWLQSVDVCTYSNQSCSKLSASRTGWISPLDKNILLILILWNNLQIIQFLFLLLFLLRLLGFLKKTKKCVCNSQVCKVGESLPESLDILLRIWGTVVDVVFMDKKQWSFKVSFGKGVHI